MPNPTQSRRDEAIATAARALANLRLTQAQMTPREQAEGAWTPTSPYTVDQLEDLIRADRGMPPIHDAQSA